MKRMMWIPVVLLMMACGSTKKKEGSIELITNPGQQDSVFQSLMTITGKSIPESMQSDSLAFLILPVQASCPSCRDKTIDSIASHHNDLASRHFIIISATGGRKTINSYFKENDKELPVIPGRLFLDSTNMAHEHDLYIDQPMMYYTYDKKAYKKVGAIPSTVRQDLQEFFSGFRNDQ